MGFERNGKWKTERQHQLEREKRKKKEKSKGSDFRERKRKTLAFVISKQETKPIIKQMTRRNDSFMSQMLR